MSKLSSRFFLAQLLLHGVLEDKVTGVYMTYDLMFPADPQKVPLMDSLYFAARLFWVEDYRQLVVDRIIPVYAPAKYLSMARSVKSGKPSFTKIWT